MSTENMEIDMNKVNRFFTEVSSRDVSKTRNLLLAKTLTIGEIEFLHNVFCLNFVISNGEITDVSRQ